MVYDRQRSTNLSGGKAELIMESPPSQHNVATATLTTHLATTAVINIMTEPVISSVSSINHQDFDSISDDITDERDDVVYMRLGVDGWSCKYCQEKFQSSQKMRNHLMESHECEFCNATFSETKNLIQHLKTHIRKSAPLVPQTEKKESTALKDGFYHPTLKRPQQRFDKIEQIQKKKANTQYYIFKEKGKIKKVVRTVFKPNDRAQQDLCNEDDVQVTVTRTDTNTEEQKRFPESEGFEDMKDIEESSVDDELSCNLDDLLRSFEEEELGQSSDSSIDPLVKDFKSHLTEDELGTTPAELKMCVDVCALENTETKEPGTINDEIECMEITNTSDHYQPFLNIDLEDEIRCEKIEGSERIKKKLKSFAKNKNRNADVREISLKEKFSQCLLCDTSLESFSKLLSHITSKHFQSEVNNMITEKYPGFWKCEKLNEEREQICHDCGQRMTTRGQLQKHLGVDHNLLWDLYLGKVQQNKKLGQSYKVSCNEKKIVLHSTSVRAKTSRKHSGKQKKKRRTNQTKTKKTVEQSERVNTISNSVYSDSKLSLIPDENPYSRKFIFSNKARTGPSNIPVSLATVRAANLAASLSEPYCNLCQVLLEPEVRVGLGKAEEVSEVSQSVPAQSAVWLAPEHTISRLLVCRRCQVCVHQHCCSSYNPGESWECEGCQAREKTGQESVCTICHQSGGLLQATTDHQLAHLSCALLVPEAAVRPVVDVVNIPGKRSRVECLVCGERGRAAVHCQASTACTLAFHTDCAVKEPVDIVLGTEPGTVIIRCSYCVEKFSLNDANEDTKDSVQDLEVGETISVARDSGQDSLAVVVEIMPEKYLAVAFDDGSYSDSLDPDDVSPVNGELRLNCPVRASFEGGLYSGIYKGEHLLHWYKVRTIDNMDVLEVDRKKITKRRQS